MDFSRCTFLFLHGLSSSSQEVGKGEELYDLILYNTVSWCLFYKILLVWVLLTESYIVILIPACC